MISSWGPAGLWMLVIFYMSSFPSSNIPDLFPLQQEVYHFSSYAILAYLLSRAFNRSFFISRRLLVALAAFICAAVYGLTDEWHQSFVPGRSVSVSDLVVDGFGGIIGALVYLRWPWQR
jgi:VanZ family protein